MTKKEICPVCGDERTPEEFCQTCDRIERENRGEIVGNLVAPEPEDLAPDWTKKCIVCGAKPVVPVTGMCGPCTFGEADTAGGNW